MKLNEIKDIIQESRMNPCCQCIGYDALIELAELALNLLQAEQELLLDSDVSPHWRVRAVKAEAIVETLRGELDMLNGDFKAEV